MAIRDTSAQDRLIERKPSTRKRALWIGGGVAALILIALIVPTARRMLSTDASVSASRISVATVERGPFVRDIAAEGRVVAAVSPTMYATSPGAVTLKANAGDTVKQGQVLAVIDSPELTNKLLQEQSNADALQVDYERAQIEARKQRLELQKAHDNAAIDAKTAQTDLERNQKAFANGASLNFDVKAKKLAWQRQQLLVKDLQRQVDDLNVRSPVNGQVGQLFIAPRATVAKDAQLLTVIDLSALEVEVKVPESFARDLAVGMSADITGNGGNWKGAVSAISPEVVDGQVSARVRFVGAKPEHLRQNQRLSVRIVLDQRQDVLTVARGSFVDESGGNYAYVVKDGIATKTPIRVGASSIDKVEILQGLKEGDRIVISGTDAFNGAQRVAISD